MFEDITKERLLKGLGFDFSDKLDAHEIAKKIVEKQKYNTSAELEFDLEKNLLTLRHNGKTRKIRVSFQNRVIFTHNFDVEL